MTHRIRIRVAEVYYVDVEVEADSREEALAEVRGSEREYLSVPHERLRADVEYDVEETEA